MNVSPTAISLSTRALVAQQCHNRAATPHATMTPSDGGIVKRSVRLRAEHYRDMAAHLCALADAEPLASLRRHVRRLAAQRDEAAVELEAAASEHSVPEDT